MSWVSTQTCLLIVQLPKLSIYPEMCFLKFIAAQDLKPRKVTIFLNFRLFFLQMISEDTGKIPRNADYYKVSKFITVSIISGFFVSIIYESVRSYVEKS